MDNKIDQQKKKGWHIAWEENVYSKGRHLNRYPYHAVVSFILTRFNSIPFEDREKIKILELGCGAGNNLWFAAREGFSVAGIDGSKTAVEYARNRLAKEGLKGDLRVGDFSSLPWPNESFDVVLDRAALACVHRNVIKSALEESRRVLKPGGKMLSIIYSSGHPGRQFGRHLGDNDYDNFTGGCFQGLGLAHFCTREEIDVLYSSRFKIFSIVHILEEDCIEGVKPLNAFWKIECLKK
jgi:SAM-dependent methyltransferase